MTMNDRISVTNLQEACPVSPAGFVPYSASQSNGINGFQNRSSRWVEKKKALFDKGRHYVWTQPRGNGDTAHPTTCVFYTCLIPAVFRGICECLCISNIRSILHH